VKDKFGRETWTIMELPLPERKNRVRSNRRRKYGSAFGGNLAIINAMLEAFQAFRAGGVELPPKMIEILNSWIEINKANPLPKR
jgi:dihydrofolate reductase